MNDNSITRFEVSNFKKFDHLVVENIGQVNLITGDNNAGKTTLLEALAMEPKMKTTISVLGKILLNRNFAFDTQKKLDKNDTEYNQKSNIIGLFQKDANQSMEVRYSKKGSEEKETSFSIHNRIVDVVKSPDERIRGFATSISAYPKIDLYSKNWLLFYYCGALEYMVDLTSDYYHQFFTYAKYDTIVSLRDFYNEDLIEYYRVVANDSEKKKRFINLINQVFDEGVTDVEKRTSLGFERLMITTRSNIKFHPVTDYGDGFIRILRICLEILFSEEYKNSLFEGKQTKRIMNNRLVIDEIEVGVHYKKMKAQWKAILQLAQETGIQIFATTHSQECIEAFADAGKENEEIKNDLRLIELEEFITKDGCKKQIAVTFTPDQLEASLNSELNVRGGGI